MQAGNYEKHSCLHNTEKGLKDKNLQALCFWQVQPVAASGYLPLLSYLRCAPLQV